MRVLILGRFQPFHNGHAELVRYAEKNYGEVVIAIGSAQESYTFRNPFTAGERYEMIFNALEELGIKHFYIVPIPDINRYGIYASHVKELVPSVKKIISNSPLIQELFKREGFEVIDVPFFERKKYAGIEIRKRIAEGRKWEHLVPDAVSSFIKKIKGEERIKKLAEIEERK